MRDTIQEIELIQACCNEDHYAQKRLFDRYAESMMILCFRYIPDREDAKEVMLDAFYNVFKNIEGFSYRGEGSFKAWLKKITVNQCLMHLRKKEAFFISTDEQVAGDVAMDDNIVDKMSAKEIMRLIHQLPDGYRTVFNLYVFEEKTHKEIATLLNISENTSKSQLHKAKAMMQKKLLQNI